LIPLSTTQALRRNLRRPLAGGLPGVVPAPSSQTPSGTAWSTPPCGSPSPARATGRQRTKTCRQEERRVIICPTALAG